MIDWF